MGRSGGGGHFGGGRSGGGFSSGHRSSGSFSGGRGGSRSGRGGFSSGHYGGGFRPPRGPVFIHRPHYYGAPYGGYMPMRAGTGCGTAVMSVVIAVIIITAVIFLSVFTGGSSGVAKSTVSREPLPAGAVTETEYYTDEPGWIRDKGELTAGMKSFYKQTGVQPYLYIAEEVGGTSRPSSQAINEYAEELYDRLFADEAHFLLVFCDDGSGGFICGYCVGAQAKSVMDDEAVGILADYFDRYYTSDMDDEEYFSIVFDKTADRIMTVTKSPWPTVITIVAVTAAAVILVCLLYKWWKHAKAQKNLEAKQTQDILNTPLESFGDLDAEERAKKYETSDGSSSGDA